MAKVKKSQLNASSLVIRDETIVNANTALRVGSLFENFSDSVEGLSELNKLYVSTSGSDTIGDGTQSDPYRTFTKAHTEGSSSCHIILETGIFSESDITLTKSLIFKGLKNVYMYSLITSDYSQRFDRIRLSKIGSHSVNNNFEFNDSIVSGNIICQSSGYITARNTSFQDITCNSNACTFYNCQVNNITANGTFYNCVINDVVISSGYAATFYNCTINGNITGSGDLTINNTVIKGSNNCTGTVTEYNQSNGVGGSGSFGLYEEIFYVNENKSDDTGGGLTPDNAFKTINAAITASTTGKWTLIVIQSAITTDFSVNKNRITFSCPDYLLDLPNIYLQCNINITGENITFRNLDLNCASTKLLTINSTALNLSFVDCRFLSCRVNNDGGNNYTMLERCSGGITFVTNADDIYVIGNGRHYTDESLTFYVSASEVMSQIFIFDASLKIDQDEVVANLYAVDSLIRCDGDLTITTYELKNSKLLVDGIISNTTKTIDSVSYVSKATPFTFSSTITINVDRNKKFSDFTASGNIAITLENSQNDMSVWGRINSLNGSYTFSIVSADKPFSIEVHDQAVDFVNGNAPDIGDYDLYIFYDDLRYRVVLKPASDVTQSVIQLNSPVLLTATANGTTGLDLTWTDTNSLPNESSFQVQYKLSSEPTIWTDGVTPSADATWVTQTGLTENSVYDIRLIAVGNGSTTSDSNPSNEIEMIVGTNWTKFNGSTNHLDFDQQLNSIIEGSDKQFSIEIELVNYESGTLFTKDDAGTNRAIGLIYHFSFLEWRGTIYNGNVSQYQLVSFSASSPNGSGVVFYVCEYDGTVDGSNAVGRFNINGLSGSLGASAGAYPFDIPAVTSRFCFGALKDSSGSLSGVLFKGYARNLKIYSGATFSTLEVQVDDLSTGIDTSGNGINGTFY